MRVGGNAFAVGDGSTFEIRDYDKSGTLLRILQASARGAVIADSDKSLEKARILRLYGAEPPGFDDYWRSIQWPTRLPSFRRFELDSDKGVWVEMFPRWNDLRPTWLVFDREFLFKGVVTLPTGTILCAITHRNVVAGQRSPDGRERLTLYSFVSNR